MGVFQVVLKLGKSCHHPVGVSSDTGNEWQLNVAFIHHLSTDSLKETTDSPRSLRLPTFYSILCRIEMLLIHIDSGIVMVAREA